MIVPAMLDAFEKLAKIAGDALVAASASTVDNGVQRQTKWGPKKSA